MLLLGFSGLYCYLWDAHQNLALIKVNTKGGNRPIRARYGPLSETSAHQAQIVYAYGDCLAISYRLELNQTDAEDSNDAKVDLLKSIHGREIMSVMGLDKGKTLLTGSEDTTFKVLHING